MKHSSYLYLYNIGTAGEASRIEADMFHVTVTWSEPSDAFCGPTGPDEI